MKSQKIKERKNNKKKTRFEWRKRRKQRKIKTKTIQGDWYEKSDWRMMFCMLSQQQ